MHIINQHLPFKLNSAFYYFFDKSVWVLFRNGTVSSFLRLFHLLLSFPWQSDGENEAREQRRKKWGTVVTSHWIRILWPNRKISKQKLNCGFLRKGLVPSLPAATQCPYRSKKARLKFAHSITYHVLFLTYHKHGTCLF